MANKKPNREWLPASYWAALCGSRPETLVAEIRAGRLKAVDFSAPNARRPRYRIHADDFQAWLDRRAVCPKAPSAPRARHDATTRQYV